MDIRDEVMADQQRREEDYEVYVLLMQRKAEHEQKLFEAINNLFDF